ncbi:hypothetical protein DMN91_001039 [Ooceraea biroi]|uniref:Uncharacterized protein n=1 Tax=Ooceraea biroi TaxID=2015173 RepID=A0A3L8E616_OOCBI|nr:hypothetical protein DMN91_001039 [Ooceraea biroi]
MDIIFLILCILCILVIMKILRMMHRQYVVWNKVRHLPRDVYPFIGSSLAFMKMSDRERLEWCLSLNDRFKEGIGLEWIPGMPMIFVFKPEFVKPIFTSTVNLDKGLVYTLIKQTIGNGLLTSGGAQQKTGFLELLLDENEKTDNPLSDDQLQAQVHTFLLADDLGNKKPPLM